MVSIDPPTDPGAIQHTTDARVRPDGQPKTMVHVRNAGDHLVQIGSHYHFFEANPVLGFDRLRAYGKRLAIPAGDRVHFSPGEVRTVTLVPYDGDEQVRSFYGVVEGPLEDLTPETALERLEDRVIEPLAKPPEVTE